MVHGPAGRAPRHARGQGGRPRLSGRGSRLTGVDTIVAVATPPGAGALGVIRISGPDALALASRLLASSRSIDDQASHTVRRVALVDRADGSVIDEALCTVMRAPRSYTGEDVVELSCHGSPPLLRAVVERLCDAGARLAAPGEFTRRAFVNGRIDLARAEAVALLIGARTERAARLAARALAGDLSARLHALREIIVDLIASLEVTLDFPDDGIGVDEAAARARVQAVAADTAALLAAARRGRVVQDGVTVALVGRPNAGKSSLLNALLGRERAIVAATPGTTRDVIEGALVIGGVATRLLDTAGLGTPRDPIDAESMKRARTAIADSDLVCLVVDGSEPTAAADAATLLGEMLGRRVILVRSKSDLPCHPVPAHPTVGVPRDAIAVSSTPGDAIAVSSTTGDGLSRLLGRLEEEIAGLVGNDRDEEGAVAASLRQCAALEAVGRALERGTASLGTLPLEVALVDLRGALGEISALLGLDVGDAVLDRIFATFCVGK